MPATLIITPLCRYAIDAAFVARPDAVTRFIIIYCATMFER